MPDTDIGLQKLVGAILKELDRLNTILNSFKAPPYTPPPTPPITYLTGRWHRRDADGYGILPRPGVHDRAHDPSGNLRSTHLRRD